MAIYVYNTLTRTKELFESVRPGHVGIYLCGPTVYKPSHIGHAVGPIIFDAIKRYLTFRGYTVTWVVNITDVDDKLIMEAAKQGTSTSALAARVTDDYLSAMRKLGVTGIDAMPKASEHIPEIIALIERLLERGFAYIVNGDVYFDVSKDKEYGKLSNRRPEDQEGQRELQSAEKRNPADFALWKAAKPDEPADVKFDSPWGKGRPGWHIECSAMASKYLGETFDIHGGGMDLIFPHHENEVAQSECANGRPFVKYWLHNGLTRVNTKKVSKSDTSPEMMAALAKMTLHNLLETHSGELIRFFVLSTHYRRPIEFSDEEIESKKRGLDTFYRLFERVERVSGKSPYAEADVIGLDSTDAAPPELGDVRLTVAVSRQTEAFLAAMDDDFNTAGAIAALFELATAINRFLEESKLESGGPDRARIDALLATAHLIGLGRLIGLFLSPQFARSGHRNEVADRAMKVLIQVRQHLRKKKDFETADLIRTLLSEQKITLEDRPDGTTWRVD